MLQNNIAVMFVVYILNPVSKNWRIQKASLKKFRSEIQHDQNQASQIIAKYVERHKHFSITKWSFSWLFENGVDF